MKAKKTVKETTASIEGENYYVCDYGFQHGPPNAETLKSLKQARNGKGKSYTSTEELIKDLKALHQSK